MAGEKQRSAARAVQLLIIECVKRDDSVLNELAAEALVATGPDVVPTLMAEIATSSSPRHRVKLLRVIEAIGEIRDPGDRLDLLRLAKTDGDLRVRAAAARTIMAIRSHRQVISVVARPVPEEQPMPNSPGMQGSPVLDGSLGNLGNPRTLSPSQPPACEALSPGQGAKDLQTDRKSVV